jgi:asparagine synthase (glutamine-hydrolysing)
MCGICGIVNFDKRSVSETQLSVMIQKMRHRGPDDEGMFIYKNVGLGHVRLSIIDLSSAGHQPMFSSDGRYCIIYNGEVYNYRELRQQLEHKYRFSSQTDTEVILYSFIEWGLGCLKKFNGMFTFVIYDTNTKRLFVARDRFGIKPFYYAVNNYDFVFASEVRAILPFLKNVEANKKAIFEYLVYNRTDQGEYTFFEDIFKLPQGSYAIIEDSKLRIKKWYVLEENLDKPFESSDEFYETLKQSIRFRLRSDVPIGVCLSGGLDSSSITSVLLKEYNKYDLNTFSAVYGKGIQADESDFIIEYSSALKNMYYTYPTAESLMQDLKDFVECQCEPVATLGPYAQYKVMELARDHVKVTLDGQGADEELAGYHYFFGVYFKELLLTGKFRKALKEFESYLQKYRSLLAFKYLGLYMSPALLKDSIARHSHNFITDCFFRSCKKNSDIKNDLYNPKTLNESLLQHFHYKLEHLLKWEDHNSMWFSLESRVPFLDYNIVERTISLPPDQKINKAITKVILRDAMKGVLPEKIRKRTDKIGFATPWETWFRTNQFKIFIFDLINSRGFKERGYLNPQKCNEAFKLHLVGKVDISKEIWKWISLELWFRIFVD